MKYFKKALFNFGLTFLGFTLFTNSMSAFDGPTHEYVTVQAIKNVHKLGKEFKDFYSDKIFEILKEYCKKPDRDENEGAYKNHFYNRATGSNFLGEYTSAKTKFTSHYHNAIEEYNKKNNDKAFEELGRALHFLEDMNTPVHTNYETWTDAVFKFNLHVSFEDRAVEIQKNFVADMEPNFYQYFVNNTIENISENAAWLSADNFYALENKLIERDEIIEDSVLNAQKYIAGMLYRFYNDVNANN